MQELEKLMKKLGILLDKSEMKLLCINKSETAYFNIFYVKKNIDINKCKLQKEEVDVNKISNVTRKCGRRRFYNNFK